MIVAAAQVHFTRAGASCLWRHARRWWRSGYYACLRATNQLRHSERWQAVSARLQPWVAKVTAQWEATGCVRHALWDVASAAARWCLQVVHVAGSALRQRIGPSTGWLVTGLRSAGITLPPALQKVFAPQQQQPQQRPRAAAPGRRGSNGAHHRSGGTPRAGSSSGGEEDQGRQKGQHTTATPTSQPHGVRGPDAAAQKPKGKGKGKGRKR